MKSTFVAFASLIFINGAQSSDHPIKNFLQIPYSFESATGISQKTPDIAGYYSNQKGKLPQKGFLSEINVPGVLTQMSYGSLFCEKLILSDSKLAPTARWVHKQIDFGQKASDWADAKILSVLQEYSEIFWQRDLEADELGIFRTEFSALRSTFPNNVASNQPLLTSICSVFAGSLNFLILVN